MMAGAATAQADDYPYLTFETADGTKVSVAAADLTLTISDGKLVVNNGAQSFTLTELSKMYFSSTDVTPIDRVTTDTTATADANWYSLDGRKLPGKPTTKGIYINNGKKISIQ